MPSMNSGAHQLLMDFNILKLHIPPPDKTTNLYLGNSEIEQNHPIYSLGIVTWKLHFEPVLKNDVDL